MLVSKTHLYKIAFFCFFLDTQGLEQASPKEDDIIVVAESSIRNITNNLFFQLNLKDIKLNKRLRQFVIVHNFFTGVTLKDHKTLNDIVRLTRIDKHNVKNETKNLMELLNEILNDDLNTADDNSIVLDEDVVQYIDEFLSNINGFKESSGFNNNYESLEIKDEILKVLINNDTHKHNVSHVTLENDEKEAILSSNEYWEPKSNPDTRRIYDGKRTKINEFPFMASIHVFNNFQCGGSIIKYDLIITAASCLQLAWNNRLFRENPSFLSVRVGSNFYKGGGDYISIMEMYFHPDYNPKNLGNNLVLLRLIRHLKFRTHKKRMKIIEFDRRPSALPMTADGITIVGWGAKSGSNIVKDAGHNYISYSVLDVYGLQECQEIYSKEYVTYKNFCAGFFSKGGGACNHDVGDPGVVSGVLAGIVSFGSPVCGTPDAPTVFTKVGYYADWIEEIMEQDVTVFKQPTTRRKPPFEYNIPNLLFTKPTSILPILEEVTPIPLEYVDNLRILKDEGKFQEFLSTMFQSNEAEPNDYSAKEHNVKDVLEMRLRQNDKQTDSDDQNKESSSYEIGLDINSTGVSDYFPIEVTDTKLSNSFEITSKKTETYEPFNEMRANAKDNFNIKKYLLAGITAATKSSEHSFEVVTKRNKRIKTSKKLKNAAKLSSDYLGVKDYLEGISSSTHINKHRFQTDTLRIKNMYKPYFSVPSELSEDSDELIHKNIAKIFDKLADSDTFEEFENDDSREQVARMKAYDETQYDPTNKNDVAPMYSTDERKSINEGSSTLVDPMSDLSFKKNLTNAVLNLMRNSEFSDVLTEVIKDMTIHNN